MAETILRPAEAAKRCGVSRSMLFALKAKGEFPAAVRITSRTIGFLESDVDAWIQQRVAASRGEAQPKED